MPKLACLAFALMLPAAPAFAQTAAPPGTLPPPAMAPGMNGGMGGGADAGSKLPLAAMRHQQPTQSEVTQREVQHFSEAEIKAQQAQDRAELTEIYNEVMSRSEPPPADK